MSRDQRRVPAPPTDEHTEVETASFRDAQRMNERKRQQTSATTSAATAPRSKPWRRREQDEVERGGIPQRRENRGNNCRSFSFRGRRNRVRRTSRSRTRRGHREHVRHQPALRNRKGRHEHVGEEIDDQVERVARPARQQRRYAYRRASGPSMASTISARPSHSKHRRPGAVVRRDQREQRTGRARRGQQVNAKGADLARRRTWCPDSMRALASPPPFR